MKRAIGIVSLTLMFILGLTSCHSESGRRAKVRESLDKALPSQNETTVYHETFYVGGMHYEHIRQGGTLGGNVINITKDSLECLSYLK